ncbi:polysaccharide deacetylase family protein [Mycobacterium kansasii]|uniref:Polysaccharide deacetylase family protein n=1 Tax=Mycobacterium kansasii TaxID=1768 RepID=A0A1V3XJ28_MYCKA|nr:polysaccharide deacetylase family protein [Mycobacterium kansasii]
MPKRPDNQAWRYWRTVIGVVVAVAVLVIGGLTGHVTRADNLNCSVAKCVALTFDDGPGPYTDRLLQILKDNDAKATFFLIGNKVAANPAAAKRIADAGMEIGSHTWEHPNMTTIPPEDIAGQFARANDAITAATGRTPTLYRPAGGLSNDAVRRTAATFGQAEILWDVIPFDWANDSNTAATRLLLMTQIKPGSVVLFHDTYSSTVDLVYQFIPVLKANGYRLVTVSELLGPRAPEAATEAGRTGRPSTNSTTSRPLTSRRCPTRPHPSRCPTSRSPTFPAKTRAGRTTVRRARGSAADAHPPSARRLLAHYALGLAIAYVLAVLDASAVLVPLRGHTYVDFAEKNMVLVSVLVVLGTVGVAVGGVLLLAPTLRWFVPATSPPRSSESPRSSSAAASRPSW